MQSKQYARALLTMIAFTVVIVVGCLSRGPVLLGPNAETRSYQFVTSQSTLVQIDGYESGRLTYNIAGTFQLIVDFTTGGAAFTNVDAWWDYYSDLESQFNLTELSGTVANSNQINFTGFNHDGGPISLQVQLDGDRLTLTGTAQAPWLSNDYPDFEFNAQAVLLADSESAQSSE